MRFQIDWASLIVEGKFTVFALFYFVSEGNFASTNPRGLIFGGAYTWRGLFSEFYGIFNSFYLLHSYNPSFLLGVKKSLGHAKIGLL